MLGGEDVDHALPVNIGLHQVGKIQRRFAEELLPPLLLQRQQFALDGRRRWRR
ncbi:MAG: hypothetical protein MPW15_01680 [Candidatus Manganitrophus sp.]|nr:hypothetical protein [Candidatus Manganitrophus sp.]